MRAKSTLSAIDVQRWMYFSDAFKINAFREVLVTYFADAFKINAFREVLVTYFADAFKINAFREVQ